MKYLLLFLICTSCGQEDHRQQKCVLYGEECRSGQNQTEEAKTKTGPRGPAGKPGKNGAPGETGAEGEAGDAGQDGTDGIGCSISPAINGALITCATGSVLVLNGLDAEPSSFSVTELIDPCGPESSWDEILLKLANNDIIASFSENVNGKNTRFVRLVPGNYQTTDGTFCAFSVTPAGDVIW